ncbi:MAG: NADH-quinone oxidoreductase subunit J [Bacteroidetes bacterium]|nr:NADH-quinone oxidoreductase subunit J [Bacteroidota bacterium]
MSQIAFYILSFLSVVSALLVIFSKKPVHSVLYLVFCFFTIAGHYVLLNAQFLAAVHIIVYAGAIMVLFLFVVMLLNLSADIEPHEDNVLKVSAVVAGGCLMLIMTSVMKTADTMPTIESTNQIGVVKNLGLALYQTYMLPFELLSVLLLSAMVGSVLIAKKEDIENLPQ